MENKHDEIIQEVIKTINWSRIKYFHKVFGIKWQFQEKEGCIIEKYPDIIDLKEELRTLLKFVIDKDLPELEYEKWLIRWSSEPQAKLQAIFLVEDSMAVDITNDDGQIELMRQKMATAIEDEQYEDAAELRDKINSATSRTTE